MPQPLRAYARRVLQQYKRSRLERLPAFDQEALRRALVNELGVTAGDVVFVHSSVDQLELSFAFPEVLRILVDVVGPSGTLLFPTYPKLGSAAFARSGQVFDIRKTPSYMGALTELARRNSASVRSLHPTKSVCAIGPLARTLTEAHSQSPYPFDQCSPYYQLMTHGGKIIGLGVTSDRLSFVHCVEDAMRDRFPVSPYLPEPFDCVCRDYNGESVVVSTYVHDASKMKHRISHFAKRNLSPEACQDLTISGRPFFRSNPEVLFRELASLAERGCTIYPRSAYR